MKNRESHFTEVLMARRENKERAIEDKWTFDYTKPGGPHAYEVTFQEIIDQPWKDFLIEQKEKQGSTAGLDFMGGGSCFDNLPIDKKLAIRLLDKIAKGLYKPLLRNKLNEVEVIEGDVLSKNTWRKVSAWSEKETQGRGFDLILSRPIGGLMEAIPRNIDVHYFLIEKLWELLNKDNGILYTQLPVIAGIPHKENLLEKKLKLGSKCWQR